MEINLAICLPAMLLAWSLHQQRNMADWLKDAGSQRHLAAELRNPWNIRDYRRWLHKGLRGARSWFGRGQFSGRGFCVCVALAVLYTNGIFLVTWVLGGPGWLGTMAVLPVLPVDWPVWLRLVSAAGIAAAFAVMVVVSRQHFEVDTWLMARVARLRTPEFSATTLAWVVQLTAALIAGSFTCYFGVSWSWSLLFIAWALWAPTLMVVLTIILAALFVLIHTGSILSPFVLGLLLLVAVILSGVLAGAEGACVVGVAVVTGFLPVVVAVQMIMHYGILPGFFGLFDPLFLQTLFLFTVLLPVINAGWYWLSWGISRWLGILILLRRLVVSLVGHGVIAAAVGLGLLVCLAVSLPAAVEGDNLWAIAGGCEEPVALHALLVAAAAAPWGANGFWITSMLVTTLVPTAIHLSLLIASVLTLSYPRAWRHAWARQLDSDPSPLVRSRIGLVAVAPVARRGGPHRPAVVRCDRPDWLGRPAGVEHAPGAGVPDHQSGPLARVTTPANTGPERHAVQTNPATFAIIPRPSGTLRGFAATIMPASPRPLPARRPVVKIADFPAVDQQRVHRVDGEVVEPDHPVLAGDRGGVREFRLPGSPPGGRARERAREGHGA